MLSNEIIEDFLASNIRITSRAIRLMKKESPERYERELIGSLFKNAGLTLNDVIEILNNQPSLFNLGVYKKTLAELISFKKIVCQNDNLNENNGVLDFQVKFLNAVFQRYTNNENEQFRIYVEYENEQFENPKINVELIDITCVEFEYIQQISFFSKDNLPLEKMCNSIKEAFPTMKKDIMSEYYPFEFEVEILLYSQEELNIGKDENLIRKSMPKDYLSVKSILFKVNDDLIFEYSSDSFFRVRKVFNLTFKSENFKDELEKELAYFNYLNEVKKLLRIDDAKLEIIQKKVERYFYLRKSNLEDELENFSPLLNYEIYINELISKGVVAASDNILSKIIYSELVPFVHTSKLKSGFKKISDTFYVSKKPFITKGRYMNFMNLSHTIDQE